MTIHDIPALNAVLNGTATLLLIAGFILIRSGRRKAHRVVMLSAFGVSALFLVGYVAHKIAVKGMHTPFGGDGPWRLIYYTMLVTHVLLAIAILPLIFVTLSHAIRGRFDRHKAWARFTYPSWLYVSVTGVLVYFFLYQWF